MSQIACPACHYDFASAASNVSLLTCPKCDIRFVPDGSPSVPLLSSPTEPLDQVFDEIPLSAAFRERFRLGALIGVGASASVYWAFDIGRNHPVAVKFLTRRGRPDLHERFVREGRLTQEIAHPNVVKTYELLDVEGYPCIVSEFVPGGTMRELLDREEKLPVRHAVEYLAQIADGLSACHQRGIVHRDLKPSNVLLSDQDVAKIADLGVAKDYSTADTAATRSGVILGTPRYMAPEQLRGDKPSTAADIFSCGVMLYEMITGAPPFPGRNLFEVFSMHRTLEVVPLKRAVPGIPVGLSLLVERALARQPSERPTAAEDLATRLRIQLKTLPELQRHRRAPTKVVWKAPVPPPPPPAAELPPPPSPSPPLPPPPAPAMAAEVEVKVAAAPVREKEKEQEKLEEVVEEVQWVDEVEPVVPLPAAPIQAPSLMTGEYPLAVNQLTAWGNSDWRHHATVRHIKHSGERVHVVTADGEIVHWDRVSGHARERWMAGARFLAVAPDGERMLTQKKGELSLYDALSRRFLWHVTLQPEPRLAALSSGAVAIVIVGPATVAILRLADGVELARVQLSGITIGALAVAASGRVAAFWDPARSSDFAVLDVEREKVTVLTHEIGSQVHAVALSPDGSRISSTSNKTPVIFWEASALRPGAGRAVQPPPRASDVPTCASFSLDGKYLATGNRLGDVQVWDVAAARRQIEARVHTRQVTALSFSTESLFTGSVDCSVRELSLATGDAAPIGSGHTGPVRRLIPSRDGSLVLSQGMDGTARLWDPATGTQRARFGGHTLFNIAHATLSEDGRHAWAGDRRLGPLQETATGTSAWAAARVKDVAIGPAAITATAVLVASSRGLVRYRLADGNLLEEKPFPAEVERPLAFVERGSRLLCLDKLRQLRLFDLRDGRLSKSLPAPSTDLKVADVDDWENFALSSDGRVLVVGDSKEGLWFWHLPESLQLGKFTMSYADGALAVDPTGTRLAVIDASGDLCLHDLTGALLARWPSPERAGVGSLGPLAFLSNSRLLAATPTGPILLCSLVLLR